MTIAMGVEALETAEPVLSDMEMYRLGLEASTGGDDGVFDLITAHKWFNLAAMQGNLEARAYRAELANEMTAEEIAEAQKLAREYLATHRAKASA
ncbi:sel1 repeat family protein [Hyphococcus sp.]|uniref:sel1 repeat family protein n=1 Tax=Hyphococcus sp. TaxID=2038636 RepID=UPI0035C762A1